MFDTIDDFEECEAYAETSTAELDDDEDQLPAKRHKRKKTYPGCETGIIFNFAVVDIQIFNT